MRVQIVCSQGYRLSVHKDKEWDCKERGSLILRSKRVLSLAVAAGLLVGSQTVAEGASRKKKRERVQRVVTLTYDAPAIGVAGGPAGVCVSTGCIQVAVGSRERYVSIEIDDATGLSSPAVVDMGGGSDVYVCGATESPLQTSGGEIVVWIHPAAITGCTGLASTGTVTLTFSNLP